MFVDRLPAYIAIAFVVITGLANLFNSTNAGACKNKSVTASRVKKSMNEKNPPAGNDTTPAIRPQNILAATPAQAPSVIDKIPSYMTPDAFAAYLDALDNQRPFKNEILAFTGTIPKYRRRAAIEMVLKQGGKAYDDITTRTTIMVVGVKPGKNKLERAQKWNTKTISWEQFLEMAAA